MHQSSLPELQLIIITHGFNSNAEKSWVKEIQNRILHHHRNYIVARLDWNNGCNYWTLKYGLSAANCLEVGRLLGEMIVSIREAFTQQNISSYFWGIGHSLGSHLMGAAGRYCRSSHEPPILMDRITGLDPAGVGFDEHFPEKMLCPGDAVFVDVIHTDGRGRKEETPPQIVNATKAEIDDSGIVQNFTDISAYGTRMTCGHADFYPNLGCCQPGSETHTTENWTTGTASHSRAHALFSQSIGNKGRFVTNRQFEKPPEINKPLPTIHQIPATVEMGFYCDSPTRGCFALDTTEGGTFMSDELLKMNSGGDGITPDDISDVLKKMVKGDYIQRKENARFALIINIIDYDHSHSRGKRHGGENDTENLRQLLINLKHNFAVTATNRKKCTKRDVLVKLDKFLSDIGSEERRIDAIIVAVMGHGLENDRIITSDGEDIHIFKEILERFGNRKCPKLEGVPQIFLIQKCRGDHLDISLEKATNGAAAQKDKSIQKESEEELIKPFSPVENFPSGTSRTLPEMSDSLIVFSSYRGSASVRYGRKSWFIQLFIQSAKAAVEKGRTEISSLLNGIVEHAKGKDHIVEDCSVGHNHVYIKQLPVIENVGFTKNFYFEKKM
ncbi:uncharacterized protein LOC110859139 isoform X2 [Folsomia candida]|uniref:uncharacterized protein LOC110859139 isoform X2 n=1 Tax=Folsomia candida TaxID=158441 RepID=UPI001604D930|nr:uncharacterized protein LOC110859139 isoform X2 [Folsomia candida]